MFGHDVRFRIATEHAETMKALEHGIKSHPPLSCRGYERAGVLNDMLAAAGQRCFSSATLTAFRAAQRDGGS